MDRYKSVLENTGGKVNEFVNPKYTDSTKTTFKKPTRLECMMQDYPLLLPSDAKVGFSQLDRWICFSPVKNNINDAKGKAEKGLPAESASSGERDAMALNAKLLQLAGADIPDVGFKTSFGGIPLDFPPMIILHPSFGTALMEIKARFRPSAKVSVSAASSLVLSGDIVFDGTLDLDGALVIKAGPGATVVVKSLKVANQGWKLEEITEEEGKDEVLAMRGFKVNKIETKEMIFNEPGVHTIES
mmetsp:Transcript_43328/g.67885  ORF Transcript_43328/g.67885 Transcript_43328/m.67885 type:complete len:244 (+) Transcript_43328:806-1537(+)